jgi:PadR family transcriptional regulator, regulatory protein PadR
MPGSDLFIGTLDLLILKSLTWGPLHGYAIGRWIRQSTSEALTIQEGVLYPALHRLERRGLLDEEWGVTETNREAKFYSLTQEGRRALRQQQKQWERHVAAVSAALGASRA